MNAGQSELFESGIDDAPDLRQHFFDGHAPGAAASCRDDAVRALLRASRLHAKGEAGTTCEPRLDRRAAGAVAAAESIGGRHPEVRTEQRKPSGFVVVRHDADDVWQIGDFLRPPGGVAAGYDNARLRVVARDSPDRLP